MMREICLVRHGEATNQLKKVLCGDAHAPLTDVGRQQAKRLGYKLYHEKRKFERTYVSTVGRCLETLEQLQLQNVNLGIVECRDDLREINVGDLADINYSDFVNHRRLHDFGISCNERFPNGESFCEFRERIVASIRTVDVSKPTLFIAHSGVINVILHLLEGVDWSKYPAFTVDNCSPIELQGCKLREL